MALDPYLSLVLSFAKAAASQGSDVIPKPDHDYDDNDAQMQLHKCLMDPDQILNQGWISLNASPPCYSILTSSFFFVLDDPVAVNILDYRRLESDLLQVEVSEDAAAITLRPSPHDEPLVLQAGTAALRAWADALLGLLPNHGDHHHGLVPDLSLSPSPSPSSSSSPSRIASSNDASVHAASRSAPDGSRFETRARIFVMSWNMGARNPDLIADLDLSLDYHIYAFGVQECPNGALFRRLDRQMTRMGCCRLPVHGRHGRIYGRGDGAILQPKFTGLVVYVRRAELAQVKVLRAAVCATGKVGLEGRRRRRTERVRRVRGHRLRASVVGERAEASPRPGADLPVPGSWASNGRWAPFRSGRSVRPLHLFRRPELPRLGRVRPRGRTGSADGIDLGPVRRG